MKVFFIGLLVLTFSLFPNQVIAEGCCVGTVTTGEVYCPNSPQTLNWYCTNSYTSSSCSGLDQATCENTRPDSIKTCPAQGQINTVKCTGCGWSETCTPIPTGGAGCDTTAPQALSADWNYSGTQVRFTWTPGAGGNSQAFGISERFDDLNNPINCNAALGANCIIYDDGLPTTRNYYNANKSQFTPGSTYYWGVANIARPLSCTRRAITYTTYSVSASPTPTPTPVGDIRARAVSVDPANTSCATIRAVPTTDGDINGTVHQFTPSSASQPAAQAQAGANFVIFSNVKTGPYTLVDTPPTADWSFARACWRNVTTATNGEGRTATLGANQVLRYDIGYTLGTAWFQAQGGDVYASGTLKSLVPLGISPRYVVLDEPGVVTYGGSYDFNGANASSKKWLVNESYSSTDWYSVFFNRFGNPTTPDYDCSLVPCTVTKPASRATAYYVLGDMTTSGNWSIGDGQTIIFLVNGNLTLGGRVNITGKGFVAFIVKDNVTVSSSVGSAYTDSTPDIEGIYVTSPTGTFATGTSSTSGKERLVLKGSFVAGNFLLQRDLDAIGQNTTTSSELFMYNPLLLITMPDAMKEIKVTWKEVAP